MELGGLLCNRRTPRICRTRSDRGTHCLRCRLHASNELLHLHWHGKRPHIPDLVCYVYAYCSTWFKTFRRLLSKWRLVSKMVKASWTLHPAKQWSLELEREPWVMNTPLRPVIASFCQSLGGCNLRGRGRSTLKKSWLPGAQGQGNWAQSKSPASRL